MKRFTKLFPESNLTSKRYYTIHIPSNIRLLRPPIRTSYFSFESSLNYFKELKRKQNFKNLPVSLAKWHQKLECCNCINNHIALESHPLFSAERKTCIIKSYDIDKITNLQNKFNKAGFLLLFTLRSVYVAHWVTSHGTKYTRGALVADDVDHETFLPKFGKIKTVFLIHGFI